MKNMRRIAALAMVGGLTVPAVAHGAKVGIHDSGGEFSFRYLRAEPVDGMGGLEPVALMLDGAPDGRSWTVTSATFLLAGPNCTPLVFLRSARCTSTDGVDAASLEGSMLGDTLTLTGSAGGAEGLGGNDRITVRTQGISGVKGGAGADRIDTADGDADVVFCDAGTDSAVVDAEDDVHDCELVAER